MISVALQDAVMAALLADLVVFDFVGDRIFDNAPAGVGYPYITFGPAQEVDVDADCISSSECFQQLDVWTQEGGSQRSAKAICGAVKKVLHGADLVLDDPYSLVLVEVEDWRVTGDPNDQVAHGIVNVRALING